MQSKASLPFALGCLALIACAASSCASGKPSREDLDTYLKARDLYFQGDIGAASAALARIQSRGQRFHQARLLEAKIQFFQNDWEGARSILEKLLAAHPAYPEAELWLIRTLQAAGDVERAEERVDAALEFDPANPRLLHAAGLLKLEAGEIDEALGLFKRAEEFSSDLSASYVESSRVLYRFGFPEAALEDLGKALSLLPEDSALTKPLLDLERSMKEATK